jgi:uncharacterized protein
MKIPRFHNLEEYLQPNKVLVVFGPRRVGKTTLLQDFLSQIKGKIKYKLDTGDDIGIQEVLGSRSITRLKEYVGENELIAIDEAQKIKNVGEGLKILVDQVPGIKIITTGSSSFELAGQIGEPLTGRKTTLTLFPISQIELKDFYNGSQYELKRRLEEYLVYGGYPEVAANDSLDVKRKFLDEITSSYLLKDILELESVKGSKILLDLLKLLAFQVGNEVSLSELGKQLALDYKTVARYLDLFEKSFVIYNLRGFSRNLRKEITKKSKYYFFDNGIRNAIISNFNPLKSRDDMGKLWENFLISERLKKQSYKNIYCGNYFWRTWDQKEVDFVEEREGKLFGYEFKWNDNKTVKEPKEWRGTYSNAEFKVITPENYLDFII